LRNADLRYSSSEEEQRQGVFENRVLRRMFGLKRDEVTGGWRKLHNALFARYNENDEIKEDEMGRECSTNGEKRNAYRTLMGKPEGKRPLGSPRSRWVDKTKMDLREVRWSSIDWIDVAQDRDQWRALVKMVMNIRVP
jgi:PAS domain-containing protein